MQHRVLFICPISCPAIAIIVLVLCPTLYESTCSKAYLPIRILLGSLAAKPKKNKDRRYGTNIALLCFLAYRGDEARVFQSEVAIYSVVGTSCRVLAAS